MVKNSNFTLLVKKKSGFLTSVYMTLIIELFVTFFIVYQFRNHPTLSKFTKQSFWIYLFVSLGLILILTLIPMPIWMKLIVFTIFAGVTGGMLYNASYMVSIELINQALIGTIGIFIGMTILAVGLAAIGIDLSFMGLILLGALIGLLVASLVVRLMSNEKTSKAHKILLIIGLILFSIYITYSTNIMLQKDYNQDFVSAAIDLYLNFVNVFGRMLALEE